MKRIFSFLNSNIGLKLIMGVTGLALALFLVVHVAGNLTLLVSPELFNQYAYMLTSNKALLYTAEAGLIAMFGAHIYAAITLSRRNKKARSVRYAVKSNSNRSRRSWLSSNMAITGTFLLVFLVFHLMNFKFGEYIPTVQNGTEMRDLAALVIADFSQPLKVAFYSIAMLVMTMHLLHGVRSAFSTLGAEHPRISKIIALGSKGLVVAVGLGFLIIPLWIYFIGVES